MVQDSCAVYHESGETASLDKRLGSVGVCELGGGGGGGGGEGGYRECWVHHNVFITSLGGYSDGEVLHAGPAYTCNTFTITL